MKKFLVLICMLVVVCGLSAQGLQILPKPVSVETGSGVFVFGPKYKWVTNVKDDQKKLLGDCLNQLVGSAYKLSGSAKGKGVVIMNLVNDSRFTSPEAYELTVTPAQIRLEASGAAGLFYGLQSLGQIIKGHSVPAVTIKDTPRLGYRGFMLDVSRHFFSKEFVMKQIEAMASFKLNRLHLHLTDAAGWRIEIKKYPELTRMAAWRNSPGWKQWWNETGRLYKQEGEEGAYGGYYTQDDIKEILECARRHFITVIPEIEMPGHSEEVLAVYPNLSCAGEPYKQGEFCAGNDEVFEFVENVLKEVVALFPSEYIHIGGDEANKAVWKKCAKCQARMQQEGLKDVNELQSYFIRRVEKIVNKLGRKMLGWDEILDGGLAPNATVMSWRGEQGGITTVKSGHHAVMTPGGYCYLDAYQDAPLTQPEAMGGYLPLERVYSYRPVPDSLTVEEGKLIDGVQANLWTEYVPTPEHCEMMIYPRLLAIAEIGWTPENLKDWPDFKKRALVAVEELQNKGYHPFDLKNEFGNRKEFYAPIDHLGKGKKVTYNLPYSSAYPANKEQTLTDGVRGGWTYGDGRWQGFIDRGRLDVTIDLEKLETIHQVKADFMQSPGPEVYYPATVEILVSEDGETFTSLEKIDYPASKSEAYGFHTFGWNGTAQARYVRYKANCGKIGGFQFVDEIIIK